MKRTLPLILLLLVTAAACEKGTRYIRTQKDTYPPKPPDFAVIVTEGDIERKYLPIGVIQVVRKADSPFEEVRPEQLIPLFEEQARLNGADAVIRVRFDLPANPAERIRKLTGRGVAVRILY